MRKTIQILLTFILVAFPIATYANRAGVVVRGSNGQDKSACVDFSEDSISGIQLLSRAGFKPILEDGFVVSVDGERAKSSNQSDAKNDYWFFWIDSALGWKHSPVGGTYRKVKNGELDGWQRGGGQLKLNNTQFSNICPKKKDVAVVPVTENKTQPTKEYSGTLPSQDTPATSKEERVKKTKIVPVQDDKIANQIIKKGEEPNDQMKNNNLSPKEQKIKEVSSSRKNINFALVALILLATILAGFLTPTLFKRKKR